MGERRRRIDKVLDPEFLVDLSEWPLDELRSRHAECLEIETEVSYVRRMTQARIDILEAEIDRLTRRLGPSMDIEWKRGRERLITDDTLAKMPNLDDDQLQSTLRELGQLEQEVSQQRRRLHQVIGRMEADLAARHKVGQA